MGSRENTLTRYLKPVILGIALFAVLYLEPLHLGGIKVAHLWKLALLYLLVIVLLLRLVANRGIPRRQGRDLAPLALIGCAYSFWPLVGGLANGNLAECAAAALQRVFPVLTVYVVALHAPSERTILRWLRWGVVFVAVSAVPFQLGLLQPLGTGYDVVTLLGAREMGFVGVFQNQHSASLAIGLCLILAVSWGMLERSTVARVLVWAAAAFLLLLLVQTYTRSGLAAAAAGLAVYSIGLRRVRTAAKFLVLLGVMAVFFMTVFEEFEVARQRLLGRTRWSRDVTMDISRLGSGRTRFWATALAIYGEAEPIQWVVGIGEANLQEEMDWRLNRRVFAHNGFINELVSNGAVGLVLMILFYLAVRRGILGIPDADTRRTGLAVLAAWLTFLFFQGGEFPLYQVALMAFAAVPSGRERAGPAGDAAGPGAK